MQHLDTDWAKRFRKMSRQAIAAPQFGGYSPRRPLFGAGELDAVVAYRKLWDPYVMATARAMGLAAQALSDVSQNPPDGFTQKELADLAASYAAEQDALAQDWNQFAGKSQADIVAEASVMISAMQATVLSTQKFWQDENASKLHPAGDEPQKPSAQARQAVQSVIDASGVMQKSSLSLAFESVTGLPSPSLPSLPSAATALQFAKDHALAIGVGVLAVTLGVGLAAKAGKAYLHIATAGLL